MDSLHSPIQHPHAVYKQHTITVQDLPPVTEDVLKHNVQAFDKEYYEKGTLSTYFNKSKELNHPNAQFVGGRTGNGFIDAFLLAYFAHGELVLNPDDIWLQISMNLSKYISKHSETFRKYIVDHQGKKTLVVKYSYLEPGFENIKSKDFRWDKICDSFQSLVKKNTKNGIDALFENNFTTSDVFSKTAGMICLMSAAKKFFKYVMQGGGCGFTKLHVQGELEDWVKIVEKIKKIQADYQKAEPRLIKWTNKLLVIVGQIIGTYEGRMDKWFWNSVFSQRTIEEEKLDIYEDKHMAQIDYVNGWIIDFIWINSKSYNEEKGMVLGDISKLVIKAPVTSQILGLNGKLAQQKELNFVTEFCSVLQEKTETGFIFRPVLAIKFQEQIQKKKKK